MLDIQDGQRPFQYSLNGKMPQGASLFTGLTAGAYRAGVRDALGCTDSVTIILQNPPVFQINLGSDRSIKLGERIRLLAITNQPIVQYAWEPASGLNCSDCAEPEAAPDSTTTYTLRATNEQGCTVAAQTTITVMPVRFVYAPNVFSPNGDGRNDYFTLYTGRGVLRILSFSVFDRWGNIVFSAGENPLDSEALRWDGRKNGQPLPAGTYVWQAEIAFSDGKKEVMKGEVNLVR